MRDEYQLEEMSSAVRLGLLASDLVISIGKAVEGNDLSELDRRTLRRGGSFLQALTAPLTDIPTSTGVIGELASSTLDALQAVQVRVPGDDIQEFVAPLAAALKAVLDGEPAEQHVTELARLRELFAAISDVEVTRVSDLSRPTPDVAPWQISPPSSTS